jgi:hypothetical protein
MVDFNLLLIKNPERKYLYQERLGISCGDGEPTADEKKRAMQESDYANKHPAKAKLN